MLCVQDCGRYRLHYMFYCLPLSIYSEPIWPKIYWKKCSLRRIL
jgi:hypothetical protein